MDSLIDLNPLEPLFQALAQQLNFPVDQVICLVDLHLHV